MRKSATCLLVSVAIALASCSSIRNPYGMDYVTTHSKAWNYAKHFDLVNIPDDVVMPAEMKSGDGAGTVLYPGFTTLLLPDAIDAATDVPQSESYDSMVRTAFSLADPRTCGENQIFGYIMRREFRQLPQAQRIFLSRATYAMARSMRRTQKTFLIHTDVLRPLEIEKFVTHAQAIYLESPEQGCKFQPGRLDRTPVGNCALVIASKVHERQESTVIPKVIGGVDEEADKQEEEKKNLVDAIPDLNLPSQYEGWRFGYDAAAPVKAQTVFSFMRWDGKRWTKTNAFDRVFEPSFLALANDLPALTFVYHKSVVLNQAKATLPYIIERGLFNSFYRPRPVATEKQ